MSKYKNQKYGAYAGVPHTDYQRFYRRIARKMDYFLAKIINPDDLLSLAEIRKLLAEETGVFFHIESIKNYNDKHAKKYGSGPLCLFKDKAMLNPIFIKLKKVKSPKGYQTGI